MLSTLWLRLLAGLAAIGGILTAVMVGQSRARALGAAAERGKQAEASAKAATDRARTDDEVGRLSDAEQVGGLERWER